MRNLIAQHMVQVEVTNQALSYLKQHKLREDNYILSSLTILHKMINNRFYLPILYAFSIVTDLYSTFLASPNLEGERAFDAQIFNLKWGGLISFSVIYFLIFTSLFVYSISRLINKKTLNYYYYYAFLGGIIIIMQLTFSGLLASLNNFTIYFLETKKLSGILYSYLLKYINLNYSLMQSIGISINDMIRLCFFIILYFYVKRMFPFNEVGIKKVR